ncbi:MAG: diacylglycerol kinase family lipid kinase [Planctomycetes bacterium]|nr:diacylglycerol kinase family lipid kinase [Planctomycetota bacterium]
MARRIKVIHNPAADRGRSAGRLPEIRACLDPYGTVDLAQTARGGDATRLAAQALGQGYDVIAACGGDGTVNEVVNGMISRPGPVERKAGGSALGIIPVGSGNDFAWGLGVNRNLRESCARLFTEHARCIDVACLRDHRGQTQYFCNGVGLGFDAVVAREAGRIRCLGGFWKYLAGVLRAVASCRPASATVRYDGETIAGRILMVNVFNGRRSGGGFRVTPGAVMDDGYLDVCIVPEMNRLSMLGLIPKVLRGSHGTDRRIRMVRGRHIVVEIPGGLAMQIDGEIRSEPVRHVEVRVLQDQLRVIA